MAERSAPEQRHPPWFVAILYGLGGLISGGFLMAFLAFTLLESLDVWAFGLTGAGLIALATFAVHFWSHPFLRLFALSLSLAGHAATSFYLVDVFELDGLVAGLVALAAGLYLLYRDALHRFLSLLVTLAAVSAWILTGDTLAPNAIHGLLLMVAATSVACFGQESSTGARPAGYAAVVTLLILPLLILVPREHADIEWWAARAIATASGLAVLWLVWRAHPDFRGAPLIAAAFAIAAIGVVTTPGLALAATILVLGFWRGERVLTALGLLFLPVFLIVFYYDLEITLLDKSLMLMAGGALFLTLRQGLIIWERRQATAAGGR